MSNVKHLQHHTLENPKAESQMAHCSLYSDEMLAFTPKCCNLCPVWSRAHIQSGSLLDILCTV